MSVSRALLSVGTAPSAQKALLTILGDGLSGPRVAMVETWSSYSVGQILNSAVERIPIVGTVKLLEAPSMVLHTIAACCCDGCGNGDGSGSHADSDSESESESESELVVVWQ